MTRTKWQFLVFALTLAVTGNAPAQDIVFELQDVTFDDSGVVEGTITYDADSDQITDWDLFTSGGNEDVFPPFAYSPTTSTVGRRDAGDLQPRISFRDSGSSSRALRITPTLPLADGGNIPLQLGTTGGSVECFNCNPFRSLTGGALHEVDAGEAFQINAGLNGSWFNSATPGQGFFIDVFPEINQVFLAWFTYDTEPPESDEPAVIGAIGQRWITAQGGFSGATANLEVFVTQGGLFDDPTETNSVFLGTMTLTFSSCTEGSLIYAFAGAGLSGTVSIGRVFEDTINIELCNSLNSQQSP